MADPMTQQLKAALRATMSPDRAARSAAEAALLGVEAQPGFTLTLLGLIQAALAPDATAGTLPEGNFSVKNLESAPGSLPLIFLSLSLSLSHTHTHSLSLSLSLLYRYPYVCCSA
jgi:hypothetical protein